MRDKTYGRSLAVIIAIFAVSAALLSWKFLSLASSPDKPFLVSRGGAEWIRIDEPMDLVKKDAGVVVTAFRRNFEVKDLPEKAVLTIVAMKSASVYLDGRPVYSDKDPAGWKSPRSVDLTPGITPGPHELTIAVENRNGPAVLLAYSEGLDLRTGEGWEATKDGVRWTKACSVDAYRPPGVTRMFERADRVFLSKLPYILGVFLAVFAWSLIAGSRWRWSPALQRLTPGPGALRWGVIAAWAVLAVNNFWKLSPYTGFDLKAHWEYIQYVALNLRIPLAPEGWQMFQSPLYYMVSAPVYLVFKKFTDMETVARVLRLIPFVCGAVQVELAYRAARHFCPGREDLQKLGVLIGGLLPVNLYISQELGNEAMEGVFSAAVLVLAFGMLRTGAGPWPLKRLILIGAFLGLALLSKVTPVLLVPVLALLLAYAIIENGGGWARVARGVAITAGVALGIAGWYYLRNWILLGRPFVNGWDSSNSIVWWQDPGYRTILQMYAFGESLTYPVFSGFKGFWDSIYSSFWMDGYLSSSGYSTRPPWNYGLMFSGAWLALVPTAGIITGFVSAIVRPVESLKRGELFAAAFVALYFAALMYLYIDVPIYSTAKACYTIGLTPLFGAFGAMGLGLLMRGALLRAAVFGAVASWAVFAYLAYFVV